MLIAWLKLRKRNLGPILDANGWAINNVAKMNIPFGASLTDLPKLPPGTEYSHEDPFAEKKSPWPKIIVFLIILFIAYKFLDNRGLVDKWSQGWIPGQKYEEVQARKAAASATNDVSTVTNSVAAP
jgi:hypothetical protein